MIDYDQFEPEDSEAPTLDIPASSVQRLTERYRAGALNPDLYAKSKALSSSTGLPETVVARNMPEAERRAAEPDWLTFESKAPDTAKRLAEDVDFFNLAHDDTENLSFWEKTLRTGREIASDAKQGYEAGKVTNELGIVGSNAMFSKMTPETRARAQQLNARIESLKGTGGFVEASAKIIGQMSESFPAAVQSGSVFGTAAGTAALVAGQAGPQAALPEEIITAPVSAMGGFAAGFGASMAENSYRVEAGHMYLDMVESGVDEGIASVSAAGGGIINAALETAGFQAMAAPAKAAFTKLATDALTRQLSTTTTSTAVKNFARNYALAYGGEVGTEILQEVVAVTAEEIAKAVDPKDLDSMLTTEEGRAQISARLEGTAAEVMKGMALLALPGASADFVADTRRAAQGKKNAQLFQAIGDAAKGSKVLPRDATAFENHLAQLAKDGPTDTVYVSAKDFFNAVAATGKDPNQVAQEIPSVREQWQEAQNLDADLVIPFSEYVARVAPTDAHDALVQHLKFSPEQISAAQALEAERGKIRERMDIAAEIYRTNQEWKDSADQVFDAVNEQLTQAGRYSPAVNRTMATLWRDFYTATAQRVGMTPSELWQTRPVTIDGKMPGAGAFEQTAYHGSTNTFDRFNINRAGTNGAMYGWGLYFSSSEDVARFYKDAFGGGGRVYKVDIPEDDSFLQWDLPLNDQPENVKKRLKDVSEFLLGLNLNEEAKAKISDGTITAGDYYTILSGEMSLFHNTETMNEGKRLASEALWLEGVHGIKHRDTNSYKFEGAPFNYVIFDDSAVQIQNRLYQSAQLPDVIDIDGVQRPTTNSNGKPIAQTEQGIRNFWKWFGDSQVVDEQGRPLVVYHGTFSDFTEFDPTRFGNTDRGYHGQGFYFSESPKYAGAYAPRNFGSVMPVYLKIQNPFTKPSRATHGGGFRTAATSVLNAFGILDHQDSAEITDKLRKAGHDGVFVLGDDPYFEVNNASGKFLFEVVAFNPEQIKSAVGNSGAFDPQNPNILQQKALGTFNPDTFNISLLETANFSTFLHESGHAFFEMLGQLSRDTEASNPLREDMDTLLRWIGVEGDTAEARLTAWLSLPINDRRAGHEKFAESFEQYLFEGKAPNAELQTLFARFAQWLKLVYKSMSDFLRQNTGAQLTDDVRGVMDRMLASDAQIEAARQRASATPMQGIEAALTEAERKAYAADNDEAVAIAQHDLERRSVRDMQWLRNAHAKVLKALQAKAKDVRKALRKVVEQEMLREQVYAADRFIRYGTHQPEGLTNAQRKAMDSLAGASTKLSLDALKAMYGEGPAAQWRYLAKGKYGLAATDGMHPDILATALGYKSGDALVRALLSATPFSEELDARTDQRMLEEHGELVDEEAMRKAADAAVHNQARTRVLATELSALQRLAKVAGYSIAAAREYAERIIDTAKVKDLRASKYSAAEAKAAKDAQQLLKKGDRVGAAAAKFRQVLNHFAVVKAAKVQDEIDAARRQFAKMFKKRADIAKGRDADIVAAAQAVLARYGLAPANKDPSEYLAKVAEYAPEFAADLVSIIGNTPAPRPWDQLTVGEFLAVRDAVTSLWTMAKRSKEIEVDGRRVAVDQAVSDLFNQADIGDTDNRIGITRDVVEIDKFKMLAYGARAAMRRVESWVDMMDNGKTDGPFRRYLFTPVREAVDRYRIAKRDVMQRYADLIKTIERGLTFAPIDAPELGYQFAGGKASIIGAMLHTGNESNLQKLLRGRNWGDFREDGSLDTSKWAAFMQRMTDEQVITKADWDFVQGVWDLLEELKPQAQTAHHDMYGYYFDEVQAAEVITPFGRYRGGYFPAMADPASSASALQFEDAEAVLHGQNSFMLPTTGRGFTKSRTEGARPLVMDLRATTQHIDKLLRFVHVEPRIKDAYRIVRHPAFKGMADKINPQLINSMLLPWMQRTAQQLTGQPGADFLSRHFGKLLNKLRTRTGLNMMVLNIVNALQQVTGFSMAAVKVGPGHLNAALWQYMGNATTLSAFIDAKSNFMQTRTSSQAMEISNEIELILNPTKLQTAKAFAERHGYFLQQTLQNFIDRTVWLGAYNQATAQGLDDTTAVRQADAAVRQTQGSFNAEDISRVEAGSPLSRLFTMFYSYFNMQSNLLTTEFAKSFKADGLVSGRALYVYAMGFMIPAVVAELIAGVARGEIDDEDDDGYMDEYLALFFNAQARTLSAMAPYVNVLTTAGLAKYDGKWYNDRISASPAVSTLDSAVSTATLPFDVMFTDKEINAKKAARDFFTTLGLITGIPAGVINRPIGWVDQATDGK